MDSRDSPGERNVLNRLAIRGAKTTAVVDGLRRCIQRFPQSRWLDESSPCLSTPGKFLKTLSDDELNEHREDLADFAAASSILHCTDSWSLLGDASLCLLNGQMSQAVHLIYYAELRAALSLMASTGVLVVNDDSVAIGNREVRRIKPGSSHDLLWQVFAEWCASDEAQGLLSQTLRFHKIPMTRWVAVAKGGGSGIPAVAELLQGWGVDLKNATADRDSRNLASYNPSHLFETPSLEYGAWATKTATALAAFVEPAAGGFPVLDNALFSSVLYTLVGADDTAAHWILRETYGSKFEANRVLDLIQDLRSSGPNLIDLAGRSESSSTTTVEVVESMLGRALILARLSTGVAEQLQHRAGAERSDFAWWSDDVAVRHGFWLPPDRPDDLVDLWADLNVGIGDLESVVFTQPGGVFEVRQQTPDGALVTTGLARVAIWSFSA